VLDRTAVFLPIGFQSVAFDFDNDGWTDILCRGGPGPVKLMRNTKCRNFQDVTAAAGLSAMPWSGPVAVGDFDGDGFLDVFCLGAGPDAARPNCT